MDAGRLRSALASAVGGDTLEPSELDEAVETAARAARDAGIGDDTMEGWARFVAGKLSAALRDGGAMRALHVGDLAVAWGCVQRRAASERAFARLLDDLDRPLERLRGGAVVAAEAKQSIAAALLAPRGERPPELLDYSGRGPLRAWLRVIAVRRALHLLDRRPEIDLDDARVAERVAATDDVAVAYSKAEHRAEVAAALREALLVLDARHRTILRYQVLDGLGVTEIGTIYDVHRATAARWAADAREALLDGLRTRLAARLPLDAEEAASLIRLVRSQIDISIERLLADTT